MFSLIWFRRENTKNRKNPLHIHPGPQIFILPIWEENWEEKREKGGLSTWITYSPLPSWCVIPKFFPFLFYYGNLRACDLWVMSATCESCLWLLVFSSFIFLILFFCVRTTPFFEKKVLSSSYPLFILFFLMKKSFIHIFLIKI